VCTLARFATSRGRRAMVCAVLQIAGAARPNMLWFANAAVGRCSKRCIATRSAPCWDGRVCRGRTIALPFADALLVRMQVAALSAHRFVIVFRETEGATTLILIPGGYTGARAAVSFQGILRAWAVCVILLM
jgi:hypothetical protein